MSTISVSNIVTANGSEPLTLSTGNTSALPIVITTTGNFGVGTSSPSDKFQVYGNSSVDFSARVDSITAGDRPSFRFIHTGGSLTTQSTANSRLGLVSFLGVSDANSLTTYAYFDSFLNGSANSSANSYLKFHTYESGSLIESLRIAGSTTTVNGHLSATSFSGFGIGFGSNLQILTSGTSWTVPTGVKRWKVTVVGGGGQGGGSAATSGHVGNGGGSGAVVVGFYDFVAGKTAMTYNIGAAGSGAGTNATGTAGGASNTTYNAVVYNAGGGGGGINSGTVNSGGAAGTGTGGTWNFAGDKGHSGGVAAATNPVSGVGGDTRFGLGMGGGHTGTAAGATGEIAEGYGAGGAGGKSGSSATARAGGAGVQGIIIVEW